MTRQQSQLSKSTLGGNPLETESNLNYEMDHQESPIDLINETARMKHLNVDEFRANRGALLPEDFESAMNSDFKPPNSNWRFSEPFGYEYGNHNGLQHRNSDANSSIKIPQLCRNCTLKLKAQQNIEKNQKSQKKALALSNSGGKQKSVTDGRIASD